VTETQGVEWPTEQFERNRTQLRALACRVLGSLARGSGDLGQSQSFGAAASLAWLTRREPKPNNEALSDLHARSTD
jgi:hypothetical protein